MTDAAPGPSTGIGALSGILPAHTHTTLQLLPRFLDPCPRRDTGPPSMQAITFPKLCLA